AHDADGRVVQDLASGALDDVDAVDAAVAVQADGEDQVAAQPAGARGIGKVEGADALDVVRPGAHVGRIGVFPRVGGNELLVRALGLGLRLGVDLRRQSGHFHAAVQVGLRLRTRLFPVFALAGVGVDGEVAGRGGGNAVAFAGLAGGGGAGGQRVGGEPV